VRHNKITLATTNWEKTSTIDLSAQAKKCLVCLIEKLVEHCKSPDETQRIR
jgi:hypothetical protein